MSETKTVNTTGGISFIGLLQIVFITLKLCKVIDWSWWWVMAPFELWLIIYEIGHNLLVLFLFTIFGTLIIILAAVFCRNFTYCFGI